MIWSSCAVSRSMVDAAVGAAAGGSKGVLLSASADRMTSAILSGSRKPVAVNLTGDGAGLSQCCIDLLPINLLSGSDGNHDQRHNARDKHSNDTHDCFSFVGAWPVSPSRKMSRNFVEHFSRVVI